MSGFYFPLLMNLFICLPHRVSLCGPGPGELSLLRGWAPGAGRLLWRAHARERASCVLTTLDFRSLFKRHCSSTGCRGHSSAASTQPQGDKDPTATSFASLCCCSFFFLLFSLFFSFVVGLFPKAWGFPLFRPLPFPGSESEPLPLSTCNRANREAVVRTELSTAEAMAQTVLENSDVNSNSCGQGKEEAGEKHSEEKLF